MPVRLVVEADLRSLVASGQVTATVVALGSGLLKLRPIAVTVLRRPRRSRS
jgi:hypothetical protein